MSIVRLSVLKDAAYAPKVDGSLVMEPYDPDSRSGFLGTIPADSFTGSDGSLGHYLRTLVAEQSRQLAPGMPVVLMVHGFLFDPRHATSPVPKESDNPHSRLYHFGDGDERDEQRHHTSSWPLRLGFADGDEGKRGLALAFGWHSQPGFASSLISHFQNFYARAYEYAGQTAWVFLNTLEILAELLPQHPLHIFCHSLGSRVVVRALALASKHRRSSVIERLGSVIVLGGAEYVVEAQLLEQRLKDLGPSSRPAFYNFVSRENDVLDKLGENFGPRTFGSSQVIGHNGLGSTTRADHWIDLQVDHKDLQEWMRVREIEISGDRPWNVWDHWYYYTFRGNMRLYERILRDPDSWRIEALREAGIPDGVRLDWRGD